MGAPTLGGAMVTIRLPSLACLHSTLDGGHAIAMYIRFGASSRLHPWGLGRVLDGYQRADQASSTLVVPPAALSFALGPLSCHSIAT